LLVNALIAKIPTKVSLAVIFAILVPTEKLVWEARQCWILKITPKALSGWSVVFATNTDKPRMCPINSAWLAYHLVSDFPGFPVRQADRNYSILFSELKSRPYRITEFAALRFFPSRIKLHGYPHAVPTS